MGRVLGKLPPLNGYAFVLGKGVNIMTLQPYLEIDTWTADKNYRFR